MAKCVCVREGDCKSIIGHDMLSHGWSAAASTGYRESLWTVRGPDRVLPTYDVRASKERGIHDRRGNRAGIFFFPRFFFLSSLVQQDKVDVK